MALLNQAVAFFNAGSRCAARLSISPTVMNSPMAPAVVCYAFAAELYLKLLHTIVLGSAEKIHGLADIFAALPSATRQQLSDCYELKNHKIEADIATVNSAFVDWRYLHEQAEAAVEPGILVAIARHRAGVIEAETGERTCFR